MNFLLKELNDFELDHAEVIVSIKPAKDNFYQWEAKTKGPADTLYEGGLFCIKIEFSERYPFEKPNIKFITPVYHPNIDVSGNVCVDVLDNWNSSLNIHDILLILYELLLFPNPNSGLRRDVAEVYKSDEVKFNRISKEWINLHAFTF